MRRGGGPGRRAAGIAALLCGLAAASAPAADAPARGLADLSLEELADIEVTSVSRRAERLGEAAASIFVVTNEMIRRAGVASLAEALRLAPNLQVARIDAAQYAISARGFNNAIGNKLLVLIDGRTVYAPYFSGVVWDQQDVLLEDVERIEVISGPGATLWGANAVNGVINVITRAAADTQGSLAVFGGGNRDALLAGRHGGTLGTTGHWRAYAKLVRLENTRTASGGAVADGWERQQIGFRADWGDAQGGFTLQGDAYRGRAEHRGLLGPFELRPVEVAGANLLARWTRRAADGSDLRVQAYLDHTERDDAVLYRPTVDMVDLEFQHGMPLGAHRLLWGGGYRRARDDIQPGLFFGFVPPQRTLAWKNLFVQGEIALNEGLELTLGTKFEHNGYTGTEVLPGARLAWKPSRAHFAWAALSRAVRAPARLDRDLRLPPTPPFFIAGGPDFVSEVANVVELGYRAQPSTTLTYSATLFHHHWDKLRSGQLPPDAQVQNMIAGSTHGAEAWASWQPTPGWRLSAGLTTLRKKLHLEPGSADPVGPSNLGNDPTHQWVLRSAFNLPRRQELDIAVRGVGALPEPAVPAYTATDLRWGWRLRDGLELSLAVQDLFDAGHPEFGAPADRSEIGRRVALRLRWTP